MYAIVEVSLYPSLLGCFSRSAQGDAAASNASCAEVCSGDSRCRFFSLKDKCYVYEVCQEGADERVFLR